MHKPAAWFRRSTKIDQKQGIKSNEKLYNVKCAITDIMCIFTFNTFNQNIKSTVMEIALIEFFCSCYENGNEKMPFFLLVTFITTLQSNIYHFWANRVSEPLFIFKNGNHSRDQAWSDKFWHWNKMKEKRKLN